jgi:hypothetical protein
MGLAGHVAHVRQMRSMYKILVGKLENKRLLRRHKHMLEDNIKMNLKKIRSLWTRCI